MTRKSKPKRPSAPPPQQQGISHWLLGLGLAIVLAVLGLHVWHPPVEVRVEMQVTALRLTVADAATLLQDWDFDRLYVTGVNTVEFRPALPNPQPRYQGSGNPQSKLELNTPGSLSGVNLRPEATINIFCPEVNTLQLQLPPDVTLELLPASASPAILWAEHLAPGAAADRRPIPWPDAVKWLTLTMAEKGTLHLALANRKEPNTLINDKLVLTAAKFEQWDYASRKNASRIESGNIHYLVDDTELKDENLQPKQAFVIEPEQRMMLEELKLDAQQGVLTVQLHGTAKRLEVDGNDLRPSALERLSKHPLLLILSAVVAWVVTVFLGIHGFYRETKPR